MQTIEERKNSLLNNIENLTTEQVVKEYIDIVDTLKNDLSSKLKEHYINFDLVNKNENDELLKMVLNEMNRQENIWGIQDHPSLDPVLFKRNDPNRMCEEYEIPTQNRAKQLCDVNEKRKTLTWAHILVEEMSEVISEMDHQKRIEELIQVAAVSLSWIKSIKRNEL